MQDPNVRTDIESDSGPLPVNRQLWLRAFPCLLLVVAVLYFFPLSAMSLPGLALMSAALGWCLYQYFLPMHLIRRHAMLEHVTSRDSMLRRWLWNGFWSKLLLFFWSLILALTVLVLLSGFSQGQWLLLLASVPLMLLLVPLGMRLTGSESEARYHFPLALRVAAYLTIAVSTIGLIVLQLFGEGVADSRQFTLMQLVSQSWSGAIETAAVRETGWLLGIEAVANDSVWYLMQLASSLNEQSAAVKLAAWLVFLLFMTLQAAVFWFVLAGVLSWVMGQHFKQDRLLKGANPGRAFVTGVCLLSVSTYLLTQPGISGFMSAVADRSMLALPIPAPDPCVRQLPQELVQVQTSSAQAMTAASAVLSEQLQSRADASVDNAFAMAVPAVDAYLDWNFSLRGQYAQLFYLAQSVAESGMDRHSPDNLRQGIEQRFAGFTSSKIDEYVGQALAPALQQTRSLMQEQFRVSAGQFYLQQALYVEELLNASDCLQFELPALPLPDLVHKSAVGVGPVAGLVVAGIAARGSARVGANVLSRNATKRAVSATAARVAAKTTQSAAGSGVGLTCGPLAPVCIPALFVATWLGADLLINEIDDSLNRSAMRADMLAAMETEKLRIKAEYKTVFEAGMSRLLVDLDAHKQQRFEILRDGVGV
ncbi:MAG: hypothetical protein Q7L19_01360 [Pseudohongiella sp.]|nr:hypothetical protein [Pseudohongiella sp.]